MTRRLTQVGTAARNSSSARTRKALGVLALTALSVTAIGSISASAGHPGPANKLVGSWMVSVDRGPALPALKSLQTYTRGHSVIEISNGPVTARTPSHGAWERLDGRRYGTTGVFFRYDPVSGAYLGTLKLRHELELAADGQSFTGVAIGELRDPAGNLLPGSNTRRDAIAGERINVEPLPAAP